MTLVSCTSTWSEAFSHASHVKMPVSCTVIETIVALGGIGDSSALTNTAEVRLLKRVTVTEAMISIVRDGRNVGCEGGNEEGVSWVSEG